MISELISRLRKSHYTHDNPTSFSVDNSSVPPTNRSAAKYLGFLRVLRMYTHRDYYHSRAHVAMVMHHIHDPLTTPYVASASTSPSKSHKYSTLVVAWFIPLIALCALIQWSSVRHTHSYSGDTTLSSPLLTQPNTWVKSWEEPSQGSALAFMSAVITRTDHAIQGRDPASGQPIWEYKRNEKLCQILPFGDDVIAAYRDHRGCGDITALMAKNGIRDAARSSYANPDSIMIGSDDYILSLGSTYSQTWRSDLARIVEYGTPPVLIEPHMQPRTGCHLLTGNTSLSHIAIIEKCPTEEYNRLTILAPDPEHDFSPKENSSRILPILGSGNKLTMISTTQGKTIVALLKSDHSVDIVSITNKNEGTVIGTIRPSRYFPDTLGTEIIRGDDTVSYWINGSTIFFNKSTFTIKRIIPFTLGPGTIVTGVWYIPTRSGELMLDGSHRHNYFFPRVRPYGYISSASDGFHLFETAHGMLTARTPITH